MVKILLPVSTLVLFSPLALDIYLPAFSQLSVFFSTDMSGIQNSFTLFMIAVGAGQIISGPLADRFGCRPIALAGVTGFLLGTWLALYSTDYTVFLTARLIQGLSAAAASVAGLATVRDYFGAARSGQIISYLNGLICIVPALAPVLGAYLTENYSWQACFILMAVYALIVFPIVYIFKLDSPKFNNNATAIEQKGFKVILTNSCFLFHSGLCMLAMSVMLVYVASSPAWLMGHIGLSMKEYSYWYSLNALLNIVACFSAPLFIKTAGERKTILTGLVTLLLAGGLMLILKSSSSAILFMLPIFLATIGYSLILGTCAGRALAPFSNNAGSASALLGVFQMCGAGLLVTVTQKTGLPLPVLLVIHLWLFIPAFFFVLINKMNSWYMNLVESNQ